MIFLDSSRKTVSFTQMKRQLMLRESGRPVPSGHVNDPHQPAFGTVMEELIKQPPQKSACLLTLRLFAIQLQTNVFAS
jgi:hypothetical protein